MTDQRELARDEVHYRSRGTLANGRVVQLLIVNISARGLMARCEAALGDGDCIRVQLPVVGALDGEIRWSLGGRFGCQLTGTIALADYMLVLAAMLAPR